MGGWFAECVCQHFPLSDITLTLIARSCHVRLRQEAGRMVLDLARECGRQVARDVSCHPISAL